MAITWTVYCGIFTWSNSEVRFKSWNHFKRQFFWIQYGRYCLQPLHFNDGVSANEGDIGHAKNYIQMYVLNKLPHICMYIVHKYIKITRMEVQMRLPKGFLFLSFIISCVRFSTFRKMAVVIPDMVKTRSTCGQTLRSSSPYEIVS